MKEISLCATSNGRGEAINKKAEWVGELRTVWHIDWKLSSLTANLGLGNVLTREAQSHLCLLPAVEPRNTQKSWVSRFVVFIFPSATTQTRKNVSSVKNSCLSWAFSFLTVVSVSFLCWALVFRNHFDISARFLRSHFARVRTSLTQFFRCFFSARVRFFPNREWNSLSVLERGNNALSWRRKRGMSAFEMTSEGFSPQHHSACTKNSPHR